MNGFCDRVNIFKVPQLQLVYDDYKTDIIGRVFILM